MRGTSARATGGALCIAALLQGSLSARAQESRMSEPSGEAPVFWKKLLITVVAGEALLATLEQRVSSWFNDGTEVRVTATNRVDQRQLLASSPGKVSAWVVPLSSERAVVIFSSATLRTPAQYLVREVRLRSGLDDLGLERLASVIHSAFVALREGAEGFELEVAERELREAGIGFATPDPTAVAPASAPTTTAPATSAPPAAERAPTQFVKSPSSLIFAAGYGGRLRGSEGVGHGPSLAMGFRQPSARMPIDFILTGHLLLPSTFDADPFGASVQTTALRFQIGIEPDLGSSYCAQALVGAGADVARIHASTTQSSTAGALETAARESGTQWRSAGDLTLGLFRRTEQFDFGLYAQVTFLFTDVHYSATTDTGDRRLVTPWPMQPGLSFQGRFRSAL
jgi:hypothetical protein